MYLYILLCERDVFAGLVLMQFSMPEPTIATPLHTFSLQLRSFKQ